MGLPQALHGEVFTTADAAHHGLDRNRVHRLLKERRIWQVLQGAYACCTVERSWDTSLRALRLILSPRAIVCDRTAAWVHRVDTLRYFEFDAVPPVETCVLPDRTRVRRAQCTPRSRDLAEHDIVEINGVRVTTVLRTALDLGCLLWREPALAAMDGCLRAGGLSRADVEAELPRFRRRRGVVQLRELARLTDPRAESPGESWTRLALLDAGLPPPTPQWEVLDDGIVRYRLDLAYPYAKVAIEYDGEAFHDSPEQRARDVRRRQWLHEHGWTVIVVRKDDLLAENRSVWLDAVRLALRG